MQKFMNREFGQSSENSTSKSDIKISEMLLDLKYELSNNNEEEVEVIRFELIEYESKSKLK